MSVRLKAATMLIRGPIMTRWLRMVDSMVCRSLSQLIDDDAVVAPIARVKMPHRPAGYRRAMAEKHARLVKVLKERKGAEAGVREGREAMHAAGIALGGRLRSMLRVTDDEADLFEAARLLYRILGIEFTVENDGKGARLLVQRCSLAYGYTPLTCEVISSMDEGVVEGLNPRTRMTFVRRNSSCPNPCEAELSWKVIE